MAFLSSPSVSFRVNHRQHNGVVGYRPCSTMPVLMARTKGIESQPNADSDWIKKAIADQARSVYAPSSFSHFARRRPDDLFFEGWYLRLIHPDLSSFSFIFAIEYPQVGTVQLVEPNFPLHVCNLPQHGRFIGDQRKFAVAHWGTTTAVASHGNARILPHHHFKQLVPQGWQLTANGSIGRLVSQHGPVEWDLQYDPMLTWGPRGRRTGRHTGTWLGALRAFNPGYQILMAHGIVTKGYVRTGGRTVNVSGSVAYIEKNWGRDFPKRWWWVQGNVFRKAGDLSVTAVGGVREVFAKTEDVGMIAVHFKGEFFEFAPWTVKRMEWRVRWGSWTASAVSRNGYRVELTATCDEEGLGLLGPTKNGLQMTMRDYMNGWMRIEVLAPNGRTVVRDETEVAQVEIGGMERDEEWATESDVMKQPLRGVVNLFNGRPVATS